MQDSIWIEALSATPVGRRKVEIVERKGVGHPDTICDSIAEAVSQGLCRVYLEQAGRVLHHNADKALLVAGVSEPRLGGGVVTEPMRMIIGDRATCSWKGVSIPVAEIAVEAAEHWIRQHLRFVEPERHLRFENALRPGSGQLVDVFERDGIGANDTSVGVGYAPLTETEQLVLATEKLVNSSAFKQLFPVAGEDVKVMGVRVERSLELTLAVAFVDRFVESERGYTDSKVAMRERLLEEIRPKLSAIESLDIVINALDREERGVDGMYLTVLGTSAEGGDSGEVGRGNRVNGLISFQRPLSLEAAAGKNPVSHVGKIYNLLAQRMATRAHTAVQGLEEVRIFLCSRIGCPIERPWIASAQVCLAEGVEIGDVREGLLSVLEHELAGVPEFVQRLAREGMPVC